VATVVDLISRVRLELGDQPTQFSYTATGDGVTTTFSLGYKPVDPSTLLVKVGSSTKATPADYTLEQDLGVIHFTTAPTSASVITVTGLHYRYFTDTDITTFLNTAITQHTYNKTDAYGSLITISSIPSVEEYPIAILAVIEGLWALATDSAFDIDISAPDGVTIPRHQRFAQLSALIQQRTEQYKVLCSQLNIGLFRIEMGTLIRKSRTTNKLVPIYMEQEIDDSRRPERVYIKNDLMGRNAPIAYAQIYDVTLYQGDSFSCEFDFPFDITGYTLKAQIRTYPNSPSLYGTFTITTISTSSTLSKVTLSLTKSDTAYMPARAFWDLQATSNTDSTYEQTYIRGQVFTIQQVTLD
jgi:hypothetical protein